MRRIYLSTLCLTFAFVIGVLVAEFGLRLLAPYRTLGTLMEADSRIGYHHTANTKTAQYVDGRYIAMRTNNKGLRQDENISDTKDPNEYRVLYMGDSFVLGWGVPIEKTAYALMEAKAKAQFPNKKIQFMNGGHGAWGVEQVIGFVEDRGFALKPDLILFQLGANDIDDASRINDLFLASGNTFTRNPKPKTLGSERNEIAAWIPFYDWMLYHSYLFQMVRPGVRLLGTKARKFTTTMFTASLSHTKSAAESVAMPEIDTATPKAEEKTLQLLKYLAAACAQNNAQLVVITPGGGSSKTQHFFGSYQSRLKANLPYYFDLRNDWKSVSSQSKGPIYLSDGHFSVEGNRLFSEVAYPHLARVLSSKLR